jgi:hypothetical protein
MELRHLCRVLVVARHRNFIYAADELCLVWFPLSPQIPESI